jgi:hypothetical protein
MRIAVGSLLFLVAFISGCQTMSPDEAKRNELMWDVARECEKQFASITLQRIDSFGRLAYSYSVPGESARFSACYTTKLRERIATPAVVVAAPSAPSEPLRKEAVIEPLAAAPPSPQPVLAAVGVPTWRIGDEWSYQSKSERENSSFVWIVDRMDTWEGVPVFVIKGGRREIYYRQSDLAFVVQKLNGAIEAKTTPPIPYVAWPLSAGKAWEGIYVHDRPLERQSYSQLSRSRVIGEETVRVPAGVFRAFKIERRSVWNDSILDVRWYSPDIKNYVRMEDPITGGTRIRELTSYKLAAP